VFEGLSGMNWNMIGALGTWFSGIVLVITVLVTIFLQSFFKNIRKIRVHMEKISDGIEIVVINDGDKSLRIDFFGFLCGGIESKLEVIFENVSSAENPSFGLISFNNYDQVLKKCKIDNNKKEYNGALRLFLNGQNYLYYSDFIQDSLLDASNLPVENWKLKRWYYSLNGERNLLGSHLLLIGFLAVILTFIPLLFYDFYKAFSLSFIVFGFIIYFGIISINHFEGRKGGRFSKDVKKWQIYLYAAVSVCCCGVILLSVAYGTEYVWAAIIISMIFILSNSTVLFFSENNKRKWNDAVGIKTELIESIINIEKADIVIISSDIDENKTDFDQLMSTGVNISTSFLTSNSELFEQLKSDLEKLKSDIKMARPDLDIVVGLKNRLESLEDDVKKVRKTSVINHQLLNTYYSDPTFAEQNPDVVIPYLERALGKTPDDSDIMIRLGDLYRKKHGTKQQ